jgi:hypothetical protein
MMSTMTKTREAKDIGRPGAAGALPVDRFMDELETIRTETATATDMVAEAVADGSLSENYLKRLAKESYFLGCHYTTELGSMVSNAPDIDASSMDSPVHGTHWLRTLAHETGSCGGAPLVDMVIEWAHQLGITDDELVGYRAMPETIGMVFTTLYYMRRSYEEGLAAFGWAGDGVASSTRYAKKMYEGMRVHYGIEVENFWAPAPTAKDPAGKRRAGRERGHQADDLLRTVAVSVDQQRRIRRAVGHSLSVRNLRTVALNRWLDEPGALRQVRG